MNKEGTKKHLWMFLTPLFAMVLIVAFGALNDGPKQDYRNVYSDEHSYNIELNSANVPLQLASQSKFSATIAKEVIFDYDGASALVGGHVALAEDGSLSNSSMTQITSLKYFELTFTGGTPKVYTTHVPNGEWDDQGGLTSGVRKDVADSPYYFKVVNEGETALEIAQLKIFYSCVQTDAPEISLVLEGQTGPLRARQGDNMALPVVKAYGKDRSNLISEVTVVDSLGGTISPTATQFASDIIGEHTLTYTLSDGAINVTKEVKREVYMRVLGNGGATNNILVHNEDSANPYVDTTNTGIGIRDFYVAPSTQYYMEWEWSGAPGTVNGQIIAGAHFSSGMGPSTDDPFIYMGLKLNAGGFETAHSRLVTGWNVEGPRMWSNINLLKAIGLNGINPRANAWKMAVARDGEAFYYFIEDKLVNIEYQPVLAAKNTKPGFLVNAASGVAPDTTLSKFVKLSGAAVSDKIDTLVGTSTFSYYALYGSSIENNVATFQENGFTYESSAVNVNEINDTMVVSNKMASGNFTMSFDFENTLLGDGDHWGKILFDLRTMHDKKEVFSFNLLSHWNDNYTEALLTAGGVGGSERNITSELSAGVSSLLAKGKYHLSITRLKTGVTNQEKYTFELYNYDDPLQIATVEQVITYTVDTWVFDSPMYLVFHSHKWCGEITNFDISYN